MSSNRKILASIVEKAEDDYTALSSDERVIYNLKKVLDAVNGKGLISLYEDGDYYYAEDSVEDLYAAGLDEIAAVIESANAMFPGGCPPEEPEERIEIIDCWEHEFDSLFVQWTEDILEFSAEMERSLDKLISATEE